ncbi:MAG TPA: sigma-70 family RNA polymerase sigma factor [Polyangiaceae bacterium]|nr:sigma-70 family RNA polymerase sigma factor [Polyangiaceae bacterium]
MSVPRASAHSRPALRLVGAEPAAAGAASASAVEVDPRNFDEVFRRYSPYVARIALRLLGSDGEVDDLVQDVFIEAHRGLSSLREPGALGGWLARICVRRATRRLRRRRWLKLLSLENVTERELPLSAGTSPEERALVLQLYRRLDRLPAEERVAWLLRHVEGESLDEMVELCGWSKSTVQRRLRSAEARLLREVTS